MRLYVYGYLHRERSSRQLERQCLCNVEVMWLLRKLQPDHKTIAEFRRRNGPAIRLVVRQFRQLCRELGLYGKELVAIDGSFFKASNSRNRHLSRGGLDKDLVRLDQQIEAYLLALDSADAEDGGHDLSAEEVAEKLKQLAALQADKQAQRDSLGQESQRCLTDPDARLLRKGGVSTLGYNVQIAVDDKHHLIATHAVTNANNDRGQLSSLAKGVKQALGVDRIIAVADGGYHSNAQLKACADAGITAYVKDYSSSGSKAQGRYDKRDFQYHADEDVYRCPADEVLGFVGTGRTRGRVWRYYRSQACGDCPLRSKCLAEGVKYRRIARWEHEAVVEKNAQRLRDRPEMMKVRQSLVEHPFGSLKHTGDHFLTRGLSNVGTEMSFSVLAYNLKRAMKVLGVEQLIAGLQHPQPI